MVDQVTTASYTGATRSADGTRSEAASKPSDAPATTASTTTSDTAATSAGKPTVAESSLVVRAQAKVDSKPIDPIATLVATNAVPTGDIVKPLGPVSLPGEKVAIEPRGRAYLFRGMAGLIYSRGIDKLAQRINRTGIPTTVDTYLVWRSVAARAISDYRRDPAPIILIGHSAGGDAVVGFAEWLNAAGIPVSLLVTYDPTRIADDVPPNVERYINIYQSRSIMGGGNVVAARGFHGHYASIDLTDHREIVHINIEKSDQIQEQLASKIAQLAATPAKGQGEAVPIRYVVPGRSAIELWDSGTPVNAQGGDTLQSLAATYHVPVWALAQINNLSEHATIAAGQRIVVPRNLLPMSPVTSPISAYAPTR